MAPWVALVAALDLGAWLALPAAAWGLGRGPLWAPLAVGAALRAARGVVGASVAQRTRPRVTRRVAEAALGGGDPEEAGAAFVAAVVVARAVEGALPALLAGSLGALVALVFAARAADTGVLAAGVLAGAAAVAARVAARGGLRAGVDASVAARGRAGQWLSAAARGRYEVCGAARGRFLDAVADAGGRWAREDAAHGAARRRAGLLQGAAVAVVGVAALAALGGGMAALGHGLRGWLALGAVVAPGLAAARALEEVLYAQRSLGAVVAPGGQGPTEGTAVFPVAEVVILTEVSVRYGARTALDGVTLAVPLRGVTAVVGPNGAGKSTLAQVVAGRRAPDAGTCTVAGVAMTAVDPDAVALVPQQPCLVESLTVAENVRLVAPGADDPGVETALRALGLGVSAGHPAGALSRGEQRRIAVARALLKAPRLAVLDEPDAWLDRAGRDVLAKALAAEGAQRAVVLVTHRADLVRWVDHVVVLGADHRVEAVGTPAEVTEASPTFRALVADAGATG